MARRYPKKCPKCGEYMEPTFSEGIARSFQGLPYAHSPLVEASGWMCVYCNGNQVVK